MKLLHIIASPRSDNSNTLPIANAFLEALRSRVPALEVETLDLFTQDLPAAAGDNIETKYSLLRGHSVPEKSKASWQQLEALIADFLRADLHLITAPMWNFGIPYALKYYIDAIVQPGYLFKYNELGYPVGMVHDKKMVCITSRGGDYSQASPLHAFDFQEPYLRAIFGFVGISDIHFIHAQPMDQGSERRQAALETALGEACSLASSFYQLKTAAD